MPSSERRMVRGRWIVGAALFLVAAALALAACGALSQSPDRGGDRDLTPEPLVVVVTATFTPWPKRRPATRRQPGRHRAGAT